MYFVFAGGGSIALVYFVPVAQRFLAVILTMIISVGLVIQEAVSDDGASSFQLQLSSHPQPSDSPFTVPKNGLSVDYYSAGVFVFGTLTILFVL